MKKITTTILGLSLLASSALFAHGNTAKTKNDHMGNHMHEGKMQNHMNPDGALDVPMKAYHNKMMAGNYMVTLNSLKPLKDGKNHMSIMLEQNGKPVKNADVTIKFDMPVMPGMDFTEHAKMHGDNYNVNVDFSMMGEWAYELMFKTSDGAMHKTKGSVNIK